MIYLQSNGRFKKQEKHGQELKNYEKKSKQKPKSIDIILQRDNAKNTTIQIQKLDVKLSNYQQIKWFSPSMRHIQNR
jgi:hypothetical protein